MEEPNEENLHQDDSTNKKQSKQASKRPLSQSEKDPTEPATKVANVANNSENEELECAICKEVIAKQIVGQPENCQHKFCLACLIESSKRNNKCPLDRQTFKKIILPNARESNVEDFVNIFGVEVNDDDDDDMSEESIASDDEEECEFCENHDRDEIVHDCYYCDISFHLSCLTPPASEVPVLNGFTCCLRCSQRVCSVCDGNSECIAKLENCFRCRKDFHPSCHVAFVNDEAQLLLCPSCYLEPAVPNQED